MSRKDVLASGHARTAQFLGGIGDGENLHKVSDEARDDWKPEAAPAAPRKRFVPAGETLFVKRDEAKLGTGIIELAESVEKGTAAQGIILAVSRVHEHDYTEGQYIAFGKYSGTLFRLNGEEFLLLPAEDVLGFIEDEETMAEQWTGSYRRRSRSGACRVRQAGD